MTIRITLPDGETVETSRHTAEQAKAARVEGRKILVGGVEDMSYADLVEEADVPAERLVDLTGATIEPLP